MTLNEAIKQLHELRSAEDMPIYYKPAIAEVINVLLMDAQEVKHGQWIESWGGKWHSCSVCGAIPPFNFKGEDLLTDYCPHCGAKMDL